jgi:hypothetical protein
MNITNSTSTGTVSSTYVNACNGSSGGFIGYAESSNILCANLVMQSII